MSEMQEKTRKDISKKKIFHRKYIASGVDFGKRILSCGVDTLRYHHDRFIYISDVIIACSESFPADCNWYFGNLIVIVIQNGRYVQNVSSRFMVFHCLGRMQVIFLWNRSNNSVLICTRAILNRFYVMLLIRTHFWRFSYILTNKFDNRQTYNPYIYMYMIYVRVYIFVEWWNLGESNEYSIEIWWGKR